MSTSVLALGAALPLGLIMKPVCLWFRLRFLRHVYDTGGSRDLKAAAHALARAEGRADLNEEPARSGSREAR